ncbi:Uncharacterised protein [Mycobacteroides abscessus subsp. abscessus]|nr:Uncharacterised protein [Mycobacteroides abscessus subsp. abscessus]
MSRFPEKIHNRSASQHTTRIDKRIGQRLPVNIGVARQMFVDQPCVRHVRGKHLAVMKPTARAGVRVLHHGVPPSRMRQADRQERARIGDFPAKTLAHPLLRERKLLNYLFLRERFKLTGHRVSLPINPSIAAAPVLFSGAEFTSVDSLDCTDERAHTCALERSRTIGGCRSQEPVLGQASPQALDPPTERPHSGPHRAGTQLGLSLCQHGAWRTSLRNARMFKGWSCGLVSVPPSTSASALVEHALC